MNLCSLIVISFIFTFIFSTKLVYGQDQMMDHASGAAVSVEQNSPSSAKEKILNLRREIRNQIISLYLVIFPQDQDRYLSRINVRQMVYQKNSSNLKWAIKTFGPEKLIRKLLDESDESLRFNCHIPAHVVGRVTYEMEKEKALQTPVTLCHSGYIHGSVEAFIKEKGVNNLVENITKACQITKSDFGNSMCYHSIGHGIMVYFDNDLPKAITTCEHFNSKQQDQCIAGAFMENIGVATGHSFSSTKTEWTNREGDPYFPCYTVSQESSIKRICFAMQADWLLHLYNGDMAKILSSCLGVQDEFRSTCFFGYGKVAVLSAQFNPDKIIQLCEKLPKVKDYYEECLRGAQMIIMDFWGPNMTTQGEEFCNGLDGVHKKTCSERLVARLKDLRKK